MKDGKSRQTDRIFLHARAQTFRDFEKTLTMIVLAAAFRVRGLGVGVWA